ncbi:MAG: IS1634 family transposase [Cryomorphaceae bacterium]|nr:IS1634 family transposase [Cryomorphaceae bacterium]
MFIRQKKNKSGSISVQIVDKSSGRYKVLQTIGSSKDPVEIEFLVKKGKGFISRYCGQQLIPFDRDKELEFVDAFVNNLEKISLIGPELLLGRIFDSIGFGEIEDDLFRHLVITRIVYPVSKLKTADYLFKYKGIDISVYSIYRYLDKYHQKQMDLVKSISLRHTTSILGGKLSVVFYDVTTLYFEASDEDDLRKTGFSKDGKHKHPQIVLGLLTGLNGYPLDYDIFEGNKYEGDTFIPILNHFKTKYAAENLVVVADSGLMSKDNLRRLRSLAYDYILGARIKNMSKGVTEQILSLNFKGDSSAEINLGKRERLIVSFKEKRAYRDSKNRQKGLLKLEKAIKSGKLSKSNINNRGYNKYLVLDGDIDISIDYAKYEKDQKWDGLKGYITNTSLSKEEVIHQYGQLWHIERTFRISKSDLQIRPIYHRLKRRIEAHISISFAACKVYKELERLLEENNAVYSATQVIDIVKTIYKVGITTPYSNTIYQRLLIKTDEQREIVELFNLKIE